jgi:hypothetical protein
VELIFLKRPASGVRVNVDRRPTNDELKAVLAGWGVVRIEFQQAPR